MKWNEIEPPYRNDMRDEMGLYFGGLYKITGFPVHIIKGILYFNRGNSKDNKGHTIIYRSEQIHGKWTADIINIVEITDILLHKAAIERCRVYCD